MSFIFSESLSKSANLLDVWLSITFHSKICCDFVMDVFGARGRRRVHSTEALESLRFKNSRTGCLARFTTLCRATEALLEDA